nr:nucleotide-binding alpha-beta plait domain-containing protein [Tanacetum cinerariifolium]
MSLAWRDCTSASYGGGKNIPNAKVNTRRYTKYVNAVKGTMFGHVDSEYSPGIVLDDECVYSKDLSKSLLGRVKEIVWVEVEGVPLKFWSRNAFKRIAANTSASYGGGKNIPNAKVNTRRYTKYVNAVKGTMFGHVDSEYSPGIVLDDECVYSKDLSKSLLGRVKEFTSLMNLKTALYNEGFVDMNVRYMGGFWVMLEFSSSKLKELFRDNVGVGSWFSEIRQALISFNPDGRIVWVEVEGVPLKFWSRNALKRIAAKWGGLLDVDDIEENYYHSKRLCLYSKFHMNIFETFKIIFHDKVFWIRAKEVPGWVPELLEESNDEEQSEGGFMEDDNKLDDEVKCGGDSDTIEVPETVLDESIGPNGNKSDDSFGIYPLLNKNAKDKNDKVNEENQSHKHPPGFTPNEEVNASSDIEDKSVNCNGDKGIEGGYEWHGEVVIMGYFNEVRYKSDRFGSIFNAQGADDFNAFIANAGLEEVPLEGSAFTWCHKSATKMSKLDRFFVSNNLFTISNDYGPVLFWFFHHWIELEGFNKFVVDTWGNAPGDASNGMRNMACKLKFLKIKIREWIKGNRSNRKGLINRHKKDLRMLDEVIDKGAGSDAIVQKRMEVINSIHRIDQLHAMDMAQKAKIKWSIEGDEKSRYFHEMLNKKRNQMNIRGVMVDGVWKEHPTDEDLERAVTKEELKMVVRDCGMDKSSGPNGFTFGFYRQFWPNIEKDRMVDAGLFKGLNLSHSLSLSHMFYADDAVFVGQWSDGNINILTRMLECFHCAFGLRINMSKSKIMGIHVEGEKVKHAASKLGCPMLNSPFSYLGTKMGGVMSRVQAWKEVVDRVVDAGLFKGLNLSHSLSLSHMFYADDAIFVGQWSDGNINILTRVLECFHCAFGLRINMSKSKIMGIHVEGNDYAQIAKNQPKHDNINTRSEVSRKSQISKQFSQNNQALKLNYQKSKFRDLSCPMIKVKFKKNTKS